MKVAIIWNREARGIINPFGMPNLERYSIKNIKRVADALSHAGHVTKILEGDKYIAQRLEEFMPRVIKGERPGMVFNLSYGIQGQSRYTHIPAILEMLGVPYVGSGPLAHSMALDKPVSKMMFQQAGVPTPAFQVLDNPEQPLTDVAFPVIVKPKNEAVSFGLCLCNNQDELKKAVAVVLETYKQPVLVEQYIPGREINVGILGNIEPEILPVCELTFGEGGPDIYTYEDKTSRSGREITKICPPPLKPELEAHLRQLSLKCFQVLNCYDCARVDFRVSKDDKPFVLEINTLPSLGPAGSYVYAAEKAGYSFAGLVNRILEAASLRYFGDLPITSKVIIPSTYLSEEDTFIYKITGYVAAQRDTMERFLQKLMTIDSSTANIAGVDQVGSMLSKEFQLLRMNEKTWPHLDVATIRSFQNHQEESDYILILAHLDTLPPADTTPPSFKREAEYLYGDGIADSKASLVQLVFALRALRFARRLRDLKMTVLLYTDEGKGAHVSAEIIKTLTSKAKMVLGLKRGGRDNSIVTGRRGGGLIKIRLQGKSARVGVKDKGIDAIKDLYLKAKKWYELPVGHKRVGLSLQNVRSANQLLCITHKVEADIYYNFGTLKLGKEITANILQIANTELVKGIKVDTTGGIEFPPLRETRLNLQLFSQLSAVAEKLGSPVKKESRVRGSAIGLVPQNVPCLCGLGPIGYDVGTNNERIDRASLAARTVLLATFLGLKAT